MIDNNQRDEMQNRIAEAKIRDSLDKEVDRVSTSNSRKKKRPSNRGQYHIELSEAWRTATTYQVPHWINKLIETPEDTYWYDSWIQPSWKEQSLQYHNRKLIPFST